jgi:hypothetical protein
VARLACRDDYVNRLAAPGGRTVMLQRVREAVRALLRSLWLVDGTGWLARRVRMQLKVPDLRLSNLPAIERDLSVQGRPEES